MPHINSCIGSFGVSHNCVVTNLDYILGPFDVCHDLLGNSLWLGDPFHLVFRFFFK